MAKRDKIEWLLLVPNGLRVAACACVRQVLRMTAALAFLAGLARLASGRAATICGQYHTT
jgi:hypothetical protein